MTAGPQVAQSVGELPLSPTLVTRDAGKANAHFLGMLCRMDRSSYDYQQGVRHEWMSWWWLHLDGVQKWGASVLNNPDDLHVVMCCVAGHHPAVPSRERPFRLRRRASLLA